MRVFVLHHHLNTGGVTKVIHSQIKALKSGFPELSVKLLLGCPPQRLPEGLSARDVTINPDLDYLSRGVEPEQAKKIYEELGAFLRKRVSKTDILHVHNANLGKNPVLTLVVRDLARNGYKILNQCHDFAEDGRPDNYRHLKKIVEGCFNRPLQEVLYGYAPNYFYGTLNGRDEKILKRSGIPSKNIALLQNPVAADSVSNPPAAMELRKKLGIQGARKIIVYPVRGIRRKNLGEFVLLSALFSKEAHWVLTRRPDNPEEQPNYEYWRSISREFKLPVTWDGGRRVEFAHLMAGADKIITTSVVEGFGMGFLEPWLYGKGICGRDIPDITCDFKDQGVALELYRRLKIPVGWISGKRELQKTYREQILSTYKNFSLSPPTGLERAVRNQKFHPAFLDFAILDKTRQRDVVARVTSNKGAAMKLRTINRLGNLLKPLPPKILKKNRETITKKFSLERCGKILMKLYKRLENAKTVDFRLINNRKIKRENPVCTQFLRPRDFYLLRM